MRLNRFFGNFNLNKNYIEIADKETLNQMSEDGFIDEQKAQNLFEQIENGQTQDLDQARHQVEIEGRF